MKKIYSFVFAAVALFAAASCQKELVNAPETLGGDFTITASMSADTKTILDGETEIKWSAGDQISVFNAAGEEVVFSTDITSASATAKFTNDAAFEAPTTELVAMYPTRTDRTSTYNYETRLLENLHIAGTQTAVAGSFDSRYTPLVGIPTDGDPSKVTFTSTHCLVKFTIDGTVAPSSVKLINNGGGIIAGMYNWDNANSAVVHTGAGAEQITLSGKFEVGNTYYIAVIPNEVKNGVTLQFDGETVINTKVTKTLLPNKIYNLGSVSYPEPEEEPVYALEVERIWGKYMLDNSWPGGPEDVDNRNMAMDDEYVYVANSTVAPAIHKYSIADGSYAGTLDITGMTTGTHPVSVLKMVKNTDAAINGGKDILTACNLTTDGAALQIWAWENGINAAPVQKYSLAAARRFGDKMSFAGTWQSGKFWFRSNQAGDALVANIPVNKGSLQTWIDGYRMSLEDYQCMSDVFWYPQENGTVADYCLIGTNSSTALYLMSGTSAAGAGSVNTKYENLKNTLGVNFFEKEGTKYIAWISLAEGGAYPRLQVIQGDGSSLVSLKNALDSYPENVVFEAPLQDPNDFNVTGPNGGGVNADCSVRIINGEVYIAAMAWKTGLSIFKLK